MPLPEPPVPTFATFNDATLEVICHFDRRLTDGPSFLTNWSGSINRGVGRWSFTALANPLAFNKHIAFTANIIGPDVPGVNRLFYTAVQPPRLRGYTGALVAPFLLLEFTLI